MKPRALTQKPTTWIR